MFRSRVHWGDAKWLLLIIEQQAFGVVDRWLSAPNLLVMGYGPLERLLSPTAYLTFVFIGMGVINIYLAYRTLGKFLYGQAKLLGMLILFSAFGTFSMSAGYFEVYTVSNFALTIYLYLLFSFEGKSFLSYAFFGFASGILSLIYMGTMMTVAFSGISITHFLLFQNRSGLLKKVGCAISFSLGAGFGLYGISLVLIKPQLLSPKASFDLVWQVYRLKTNVRLSNTMTSWYLSIDEILSFQRLLEFVDCWLIYGVAGVTFLIGVLALNLLLMKTSFFKAQLTDSKLLTLLVIVGFYIFFMFIKRPVLGFSDWDLFAYTVYPINLLGLVLFAILPIEPSRKHKLLFMSAILSLGWFTVTFSMLNPLAPGALKLPKRMRADIFTSYQIFEAIPETERINILRKEVLRYAR